MSSPNHTNFFLNFTHQSCKPYCSIIPNLNIFTDGKHEGKHYERSAHNDDDDDSDDKDKDDDDDESPSVSTVSPSEATENLLSSGATESSSGGSTNGAHPPPKNVSVIFTSSYRHFKTSMCLVSTFYYLISPHETRSKILYPNVEIISPSKFLKLESEYLGLNL